jgi:hypothetical protein
VKVSGKIVILAILGVGLAAACLSWWFRYHATHRAAKFWGPESVQLIRDAPGVFFETRQGGARDVSSSRGLLHLRSALLEDSSFRWPPRSVPSEIEWQHVLLFRDEASGQSFPLCFSSDLQWVRSQGAETMLSCEPIARSLREMFREFERQNSGR